MRNNMGLSPEEQAALIDVSDIAPWGRYFCAKLEDGTLRPFTEDEYTKLAVNCYDQDGTKLNYEQYAAYYVALEKEEANVNTDSVE